MRTIALSSCALCFCSPALAVFLTLDIREDKAAPPPEIASQIDPEGLGFRTFNFYAVFDGPGVYDVSDPGILNRPLLVGADEPLGNRSTFGIRKESLFGAGDFEFNEDAFFYQTPQPFGGDFRPVQEFIDMEPALEWDTYVGLGQKVVATDSDSPVLGTPDFGFPDRDGDGRPDAISSAWATVDPTNEGHLATFNSDSEQFEAFLAQITIVGLDAGARLGQQATPGVFHTDIFSGKLFIATQGDIPAGDRPALFFDFEFVPGGSGPDGNGPTGDMPGPSPLLAVMGFVGIASARRRR